MMLVLLTAWLCAGCASSGANRPSVYESSYRAGAYRAAIEQAERSADGERAELIAAMSRHALGEGTSAEPALERLSQSGDRDVRGRALATLAIIAYEAGDTASASDLLDRALRDLRGVEATRARAFGRVLSGEAVGTAAGGWTVQVGAFESQTRADRAARSARQRVWPGPIRVDSDRSSGRDLFVVLVGAFSTEREARAFAEQVGGFVRRNE